MKWKLIYQSYFSYAEYKGIVTKNYDNYDEMEKDINFILTQNQNNVNIIFCGEVKTEYIYSINTTVTL